MATRTETTFCVTHNLKITKGTCWRCCEDDMAAHLAANGFDPSRYFDGRNGEGTPEPRPRGNGGNGGNATPDSATRPQIGKIRYERDQRDTTGVDLPADADIPALTKDAATALIKRLLKCPPRVAGTPRRYAPRMATPGQRDYVSDLLEEKEHDNPVNVDTLTFAEASALIDTLIRAPRKGTNLADGMYRKDGVLYRVKTDKRGRKLCHRGTLVSDEVRGTDGTIITPAVIKFSSDQRALARLSDADLMTRDQVCEFGVSYGICVYGHPLTDPVSVAAGIGPKCADNEGINQLEVAIANGYVPPVTRKTRKTRATVPAPAPVATEAYASPWALV